MRGIAITTIAALALAGCQSTRMAAEPDTRAALTSCAAQLQRDFPDIMKHVGEGLEQISDDALPTPQEARRLPAFHRAMADCGRAAIRERAERYPYAIAAITKWFADSDRVYAAWAKRKLSWGDGNRALQSYQAEMLASATHAEQQANAVAAQQSVATTAAMAENRARSDALLGTGMALLNSRRGVTCYGGGVVASCNEN